MSYFPDYRGEDNEKLLNTEDRNFIGGYRAAIEDILTFFDNLDVYEFTEAEEKVMAEAKECFEHWMDMEEKEMVLFVFEGADYIPEDVDLNDHNEKPYKAKGEAHGLR